jgi:hypothetical protein
MDSKGCKERIERIWNISRKERKVRKEKKLLSELGVLGARNKIQYGATCKTKEAGH